MARQSRFETTSYRGSEIRVRAAQVAPSASWTVWVDVYGMDGRRHPRIEGDATGWSSWQEAINEGFQAGKALVDKLRAA